jgi:hypothetical protein
MELAACDPAGFSNAEHAEQRRRFEYKPNRDDSIVPDLVRTGVGSRRRLYVGTPEQENARGSSPHHHVCRRVEFPPARGRGSGAVARNSPIWVLDQRKNTIMAD